MNSKQLYYFLCLFCSYFSLGTLIVNPIYILGFILIFLGFFFMDIRKIEKGVVVYFLYFISSLVSLLIGLSYFSKQVVDTVFLSSILYLYCILIGMQTITLSKDLTLFQRKKVYHYTYNYLIVFLVLDLISRLINAGGFSTNFYDYKHGWFHFDSNFTGLIIALFLMFSFFLQKERIYCLSKIKYLILFVLLCATFSRASIFAFVVSYLVLRYTGRFLTVFSIVFAGVASYTFYVMMTRFIEGDSFVDIDGSFNTKFYFIELAIQSYDQLDSINKIFGIGLANFDYYAGVFAHNVIITLIYEFGILGTILFLLFLAVMYFKVGRDVLYLYVPLFIGGFSLFSAYMPFFFILLACMYIESRKN